MYICPVLCQVSRSCDKCTRDQTRPQRDLGHSEVCSTGNVGDIRRFLGMVNQLSKFSPHLAEMTQPLRALLVKDNMWVWGTPQHDSCDKVKAAITASPILAMFDPNLETVLSADASSHRLGAVQQKSGQLQPVTFISRAMSLTEKKYAQIEKEVLVFTWACATISLSCSFISRLTISNWCCYSVPSISRSYPCG